MKPYLSNALTAAVVAIPMAALSYYQSARSHRIGVIDIAAVVRAEEARFNEAATKALSEAERQALVQRAGAAGTEFARKLPLALGELQRECGCTILDRSAILAARGDAADLTPQLRNKMGL